MGFGPPPLHDPQGGIFGHQMANCGLKKFHPYFWKYHQINIHVQNKACAIAHPQFCIPEEQTIIYSQLLSLKSWLVMVVLVAHWRPHVKFWSPALDFLTTLVSRKFVGPWPLKQSTRREGGVGTEAV